MDVLIVEPLDPEVMQWLLARHSVRFAPELADDPRALRQALHGVRSMIVPGSVALDGDVLINAPLLRAVGRLSAGSENIDLDACARMNIEVVRPTNASAAAEAEFCIGALLQMLRRVPVVNAEGLMVGRELGGATVGLIGLTPAARPMAQLLAAFGSRVIGYDPAVHAGDAVWHRWKIEPVALRPLMEQSEAVCVLMPYFTRYHGLIGERSLSFCRQSQVMVCLSSANLIDEDALADVLTSGRMSAAWFDSMQPGMQDVGRPLHGVDALQVTPRVASTTRESRVRSAWGVARRIDELLSQQNAERQVAAHETRRPEVIVRPQMVVTRPAAAPEVRPPVPAPAEPVGLASGAATA
jgi:phosphoglycerate dehydrogenase-like enzyme